MDINDLVEVNATADIKTERKIAINIIMNTEYCRKIVTLLQDYTLLDSTFVRTVVKWSLTYYKAYGVAPEGNIVGIYERERGKLSSTISKDISDFLQSISDEFSNTDGVHNVQFEIDIAEDYLAAQNVKALVKKLERSLLTNNVSKAVQDVGAFKRIASVESSSESISDNMDRYNDNEDDPDYLFTMPGAFGQQIGDIKRGHLGMVGSKSKGGKTRSMVKMIAEAYKAGLNIYVCNLEMRHDDMKILIDRAILMAMKPEGVAYIPYFKKEGNKYNIGLEEKKVKGNTKEEFELLWREHDSLFGKGRIRVRTWPQETMNIEEHLVPELDLLRDTEGWVPDMVVVDYMEMVLCPKEFRNGDPKYKSLSSRREFKRLTQSRHIFGLTATQLKDNLEVKVDVEKLSDSDWLIALHQTDEEKRIGIGHSKTIVHRHLPFTHTKDVTILSNNGIGLWGLDSKWDYQVNEVLDEVSEDFESFVPTKYEEEERDLYDYV